MYQELNKHKKSDTVKWIIAFTLIIVLMAGVVAALILSLDKPMPIKPQETPVSENTELHFEQGKNPKVLLAMSAPRYAAATQANTASVSYDITATLEPANVENKKVDWKIEWSADAPLKDKKITEYFTLTPTSDGALTAKLTCIKSFRGSSAILSVTSRDSGVVGTATVTFSGKPATMDVDVSGIGTQTRGNISGVLQLKRGQTYTQTIGISNAFGDVGSEYSDYSVSVTGVGSFVKGTFTATMSYQKWSEETNVNLDSVKNDYISAKIVNGKLVVEAKDRYENMRGSTVGNSSGGTTKDLYKEDNKDSNGNLPYYQIKVTENKSGLSKTLNVYIVSTVNTVSVNYGNIDF